MFKTKTKKIKEEILSDIKYYEKMIDYEKSVGARVYEYDWSSRLSALELLLDHLEQEGLV